MSDEDVRDNPDLPENPEDVNGTLPGGTRCNYVRCKNRGDGDQKARAREGRRDPVKAIQYASYGHPPDVAEIVDIDPGPLGENEVRIRVEATPIKLNDLYCMSGKEGFRPPLPAVPGNEGVGRIVEAGGRVKKFVVGDSVFLPSQGGTWREVLQTSAAELEPAPPDGDPVQLALLCGNVLTAYLMLKDIVDLNPGDWVLQNAANSNCGGYLVKLARTWGYKTVNVVRRESVVEELKALGADAVVLDGPNLEADVAAATGNAQIRLGIDALGGAATTRIAACLADGGTVANYGFISGEPCMIPSRTLISHDIRLIGFFKSRSLKTRSAAAQSAIYAECGRLVADGTLRGKIAGTYPLQAVREALVHAAKVGDERRGKVVLVPESA